MRKLCPQSFKNIYHLGMAVLANLFFGFPGRKIKVIGITGTNGKTTTVQMVARVLEVGGSKVALASTINFRIGDKEWVNTTKMTTLSSFRVQSFLAQAVKESCEYAILEVSSHSLDQNRVWGIPFEIAIITNITREHLDYHETMDKYRRAKKRLFKNVRVAVVNLDMKSPEYFLDCDARIIYGYSTKNQKSKLKIQNDKSKLKTIQAKDINLGLSGTNYKLQTTNYKINLPGLFNVENALAATCVGLACGISEDSIGEALGSIKLVPGRMEKIPNILGIDIIVDYAVTPDSLEKLYSYISDSKREDAKVIAVFGSCGERDRGKRPIMGKIVSNRADLIIITNEDPYGENPVDIINQVFSGVVGYEVKGTFPNFQFPRLPKTGTGGQAISNFQTPPKADQPMAEISELSNDQISNDKKVEGENAWRILDRRVAIREALLLAKPGDTVVVTGKGAEETMAIGDERIPWNDKNVILEELEKIKKAP
ncbi:MAG: Mur ligase family protein [Patescibacteria group bacterium]